MEENLLLIPGPTNLSKRVRNAMAGPQLPHVGSGFYSTFKEIVSLARYVFMNEKAPQFVFTGSGTIGMESSVVSLVSRGDRTLTLRARATPAEAAGIDINLEGNRWMQLIRASSQRKK